MSPPRVAQKLISFRREGILQKAISIYGRIPDVSSFMLHLKGAQLELLIIALFVKLPEQHIIVRMSFTVIY